KCHARRYPVDDRPQERAPGCGQERACGGYRYADKGEISSFPLAKQKVAAESEDKQPGHHHEIRIAAGADKDGGGTVGAYARGCYPIETAQFSEVVRLMRKIQKGWPKNRLGNTQRNDHHRQRQIDGKETAQFRFGIQKLVAYKEQGDVVEEYFEPHQSIHNMCGGRIEHLDDAEPDEDQQRYEKRRTEEGHFFPAKSREKRDVYHQNEKILCKVNGHVIAKEFSRKILEHQPREKKVHAVLPAIENRYDNRPAGKAQADVSQTSHIVVDHILGHFVSSPGAHNEGSEDQKGASGDLAGGQERCNSHSSALCRDT